LTVERIRAALDPAPAVEKDNRRATIGLCPIGRFEPEEPQLAVSDLFIDMGLAGRCGGAKRSECRPVWQSGPGRGE
jgi:hypothetical protein